MEVLKDDEIEKMLDFAESKEEIYDDILLLDLASIYLFIRFELY